MNEILEPIFQFFVEVTHCRSDVFSRAELALAAKARHWRRDKFNHFQRSSLFYISSRILKSTYFLMIDNYRWKKINFERWFLWLRGQSQIFSWYRVVIVNKVLKKLINEPFEKHPLYLNHSTRGCLYKEPLRAVSS